MPKWDQISARELYDHEGDTGDHASGERFEWENLALQPLYKDTVAALHDKLVEAVKTGLVKPMK